MQGVDGQQGRTRPFANGVFSNQPVLQVNISPTCEPQPTLQLELLVARQLARMHDGDLWAEAGASILVLPLHFSPLSHAILAATTACLPAE